MEIAATVHGYDTIASVGGDGTVNEVISGIMDRQDHRPTLAIIPAGTGNDIARSVDLFPMERAVDAITGGVSKGYDIIHMEVEQERRKTNRYSLPTIGIGFSVSDKASLLVKRVLGPTVTYYLSSIRAILVHRPPYMSVCCEERQYKGKTWMIIVSNVESVAGGSMRVAPGARPDDGLLWVTIVEPKPKLAMMVKYLPRVSGGAHVNADGFHFFSSNSLVVESDDRLLIDADGEIDWGDKAKITLLPGALNILRPL
jgi:diacylglycerol kinase (ATP)